MKKWKIVLPTLLATTSLPLVSLVSCSEPKQLPIFSQDGNGEMSDNKTATISIDWDLTSDTIEFTNMSFSCKGGDITTTNIDCPDPTARPRQFVIKFTNAIEGSISDGVFAFHYNDSTIDVDKDESVENINITEFAPDRVDFATCNWKVVTDACKDLEDKKITENEFCKKFKFGNVSAARISDFIGKVKNITLNGQPHYVKVVGIEEDFMGTNHTNPVVFTFQFDNLISRASDGMFLQVKWQADAQSNADNHYYWNSTLFNALNDDTEAEITWENDPDEKQSVYEMIKEGEPTLGDSIKSVYRGVNTYNGTEVDVPFELTTQQTKLFCPTLSNFFSDEGILKSAITNAGTGQKAMYSAEGQPHEVGVLAQYSFYKEIIEDAPFVVESDDDRKWTQFECLKLFDSANYSKKPDVGSYWYWITSPNIYNKWYSANSWFVRSTADIGKEDQHAVNHPGAIAPCFCI